MTWAAGGLTDRSYNNVRTQKECPELSTAGSDSLRAENQTHSPKSDHVPSSSSPNSSKRHRYVLCMPKEHLMTSIGRDTCREKNKWSAGSKCENAKSVLTWKRSTPYSVVKQAGQGRSSSGNAKAVITYEVGAKSAKGGVSAYQAQLPPHHHTLHPPGTIQNIGF